MRRVVFKSDVRDRVQGCSNNSFEQLSHIQGKKKTQKTPKVQKGDLQPNDQESQCAT